MTNAPESLEGLSCQVMANGILIPGVEPFALVRKYTGLATLCAFHVTAPDAQNVSSKNTVLDRFDSFDV
jgi:hypothetical protein